MRSIPLLAAALSLFLLPIACGDGDGPTDPDDGEICGDGIDNDGDGVIDEGVDEDGDGYSTCDLPDFIDCDDSDPERNPGHPQLCEGKDNDCDGTVDNADIDQDGYVAQACWGPDCDDDNDSVRPDAPESCDALDNDCDGEVDNGFDADHDGWTFCGPDGISGTLDDDCAQGDANIHPEAPETCDGVDQDCDGDIDEAFDADEDGFIDSSEASCGDLYQPGGARAEFADCDDSDADRLPGGHEQRADGVDDDCDGCIDECQDADLDGYDNCEPGDTGDPTCAHEPDADDGNPEDCVDMDLQLNFLSGVVRPGLEFEVLNSAGEPVIVDDRCDGLDNNCDGVIDEGFDPVTCEPQF